MSHHRMLIVTVLAVTTAVATSAVHAADWVIRADLNEADFESVVHDEVPAGFRPVSVSAHGTGGGARFTIVAVEDPGVPWVVHHGMDSDAYQAKFEELGDLGFRVIAVDGYDDAGDELYVAAWIADGVADWAGRHGMTAGELADEHDNYQDLGLRMIWLSGYGSGGERRFAAVWKTNDEEWSSDAEWDLSPIEFSQRRRQRMNDGFRAVVVTAYGTGGAPRYGAIFLRPDGPNWEIQPDWHDVLGESGPAFQNTADGFGGTDYQPLCAIQYAFGGAALFGSTWFEDTAPPEFEVTGVAVPSLSNFDTTMEAFMRSRKVPRASLAITKDERLVFQRAYTLAPPGTELTSVDDRFRVASVSKPITAVAALQLVDRALIGTAAQTFDERLDTKLVDIPGFDGAGWVDDRFQDVTVRHLLQNLGGFPRRQFDPMFNGKDVLIADELGIDLPITVDDVVAYMKTRPIYDDKDRDEDHPECGADEWQPGTEYDYSNFGYVLLGEVIEAASGQPYEQYVRENVFCTLDAGGARIGHTLPKDRLPNETDYRDAMNRYHLLDAFGRDEPHKWVYGHWNVQNLGAAAGWVATPTELVRFASDFTELAGSTLLSFEAVLFMWTVTVPSACEDDPYGAGWSGSGNTVWHQGGMPGTWSSLVRRTDGVTISVVLNQNSGHAETPIKDRDKELRDDLLAVADMVGEADWPAHDLFDEGESCDERDWDEDFDDYPVGPLPGRGGWESWEHGTGSADFHVTDALSRSAPHAVAIDGLDDAVRPFDVDDGRWTFTAWMYVAPTMDDLQHVILLNTYPVEGYESWSLQLEVDGAAGVLADRNSAAQLPLVRGAWSEVRVEIDLDEDVQTVFYDGVELLTKGWSDGVASGGATRIAAVDLFGTESAHVVFYDDLALVRVEGPACPGDIDGDGAVGASDLIALLAAWGPCAGCGEDLDGDGAVGVSDLLVLLAAWGPCPG
jgi:CubicO group peptidase (beta-lactamase class C family)